MPSVLSSRLGVKIPSHPILGRARLMARFARFSLQSLRAGHFDFFFNAWKAEARLILLGVLDLLPLRREVECNFCGWKGARAFYPNTGPGYHERNTICPGCQCQDRHRSLVFFLVERFDFFQPGKRVIEVAPMRGLGRFFRSLPGLDYTSFDLERQAMEKGDITAMRYPSGSVDYFLCFHVLEHISNEGEALSEIRRVLKPGGWAVLQVPVDGEAETTREYDQPDPREVGHVRRYGRDFADRIASHGFEVQALSVSSLLPEADIQRQGLSTEAIYFARKPG
jgi:hypothetical protein